MRGELGWDEGEVEVEAEVEAEADTDCAKGQAEAEEGELMYEAVGCVAGLESTSEVSHEMFGREK